MYIYIYTHTHTHTHTHIHTYIDTHIFSPSYPSNLAYLIRLTSLDFS